MALINMETQGLDLSWLPSQFHCFCVMQNFNMKEIKKKTNYIALMFAKFSSQDDSGGLSVIHNKSGAEDLNGVS